MAYYLNEANLESYYRHPAPYPSIEVGEKNKCYAKLLLEDYAGSGSEMTAIATYVFNHIVSDSKSNLIATAFKKVSMVEMMHLELLGEVILQLGMLPKFLAFEPYKPTYWTGENVYASCQLKTMLSEAINAEVAAIKQYRQHIKQIDDYGIQVLLERIILDEQLHIQLFKKLLDLLTD